MRQMLSLLLCVLLLCGSAHAVETKHDDEIPVQAPSAVLMEVSTGTLLYEKNAHERLEPASVTKVMTMLLVTEAIERGELSTEDVVTASARAASMGGSQIWLEEGEQMCVSEMLKCVAVVSANDCAVALAEHLAGSEEGFAERMNARARELGMEDTHFSNCTGLLDDPEHLTSAYDIALMSRELIRHDFIKDYTTIWMDTVREGRFALSNTNKLIYYYEGATGLKTGFTSGAMYCLSATAERDGVEYIAVVMHGQTSAERFESAKTLLNYAFANYTIVDAAKGEALPPVRVELGTEDSVQPVCEGGAQLLVEREAAPSLRYEMELPERVSAPVSVGDALGELRVYNGQELVLRLPLVAQSEVRRLRLGEVYRQLLSTLLGGK